MDVENGLPTGWEARLGLNGRLYYYSKQSQIVQILPPPEVWRCTHSLPYGWEMAIDYDNTNYYINHITQTVTYEDPRTEDDQSSPVDCLPSPENLMSPQPRECEIIRDPNLGFGFIAGSEKPVVIRSVTPGGPSEDLLLPDDQIVKIGSENVMMAERERVIDLIRVKSDKVVLTVLQPNRSANSSFLNPAKKTFRTMDRPKVRFADDVIVNGQERTEGSSPLLVSPGVLRIELENREVRSFRLQPESTAGDAVAALCDKFGFKDPNLFSLVLTPPGDYEQEIEKNSKTSLRGSTTSDKQPSLCSSSPDSLLVAPWDCLSKVVNNPSMRHHSCHFRLEFMPKDFHKLARNDPEAFRYLYQQCVNDVVSGDVYVNDLSKEDLIKLATIQMQEVVLSALPVPPQEKQQKRPPSLSEYPILRNSFRFSGLSNKLTLKYIEKEYGLRRFFPPSVMATMHRDNPTARSIRKSIQQYLKASSSTSFFNQHSTSPVIPTSPILTSGGNQAAALLQLRLQYLKILSPQHLFGGRYFSAAMQALMESDITILVGHNYGISQMINSKTKMVSVLTEFQHVTGFEVATCQAESSTTTVKIEYAEKKELLLSMEPQAAHNFAFMVAGYCRVYGNIDMVLTLPMAESTSAPMYFGPHKVKPSHWNYPPASKVQEKNNSVSDVSTPKDHTTPPSYFYCDFSEPITPAVLSQEIPPLNIAKKNGFHRPATPPPSRNFFTEDEEGVSEDVDGSKFTEIKFHGVESSDSNNNSSHEATYEEIASSLPESPVSSLSAGQYSDLSPTCSPYYNENDITASNGYLVPTPPAQRMTRVIAQVEEVKRDDSESEGDWMDLMNALGTTSENDGEAENEDITFKEIPDDDLPPLPSALTENTIEEVQEIEVPPPPDYPPPKRVDSIRKGNGEAEERTSLPDSAVSHTAGSKSRTQRMSSFKPSNGELKVFTLTRSDTGIPASVSGSIQDSDPTTVVVTPERKPLGSMDDVQDPVTRRKLQETEDLIQYFRQRREEISGAASHESISHKGSQNFDSSGEFGSGDFDTPIVVSDIAAGNKRLRKAEKAASRNRKSWAGSDTLTRQLSTEDPRPLSMSNPDLTTSVVQKSRGRSLFRRLFGDRKRRSHSMYETSGTSSAYGRRRRRFRIPKLRLRRAFTLSSIKKENRKSVLPTVEGETPTKSHTFRFRPFSSKKAKSHGILVISEPCDGVRGVDLLPSGKYTVAGTMFQVNGEAKESQVITVDSKRPSRESLALSSDDKRSLNESNSPNGYTVVDSSAESAKVEVELRDTPPRKTQRPVSFSTFQQAVLDGYTNGTPSKLATVDEGRRNSLLLGMNQPSPCELSLTESSEALQEIVKAREEASAGGIPIESNVGHPVHQTEIPVTKLVRPNKPTRKLISASNPIVPAETARKCTSLPPHVRLQATEPRATSTPIQPGQKVIKKRPSNKRPAPPPPLLKSRSGIATKKEGECAEVKAGISTMASDWYNDELFEHEAPGENSLVTEIFSYLESSNTTNNRGDISPPHGQGSLPHVEEDISSPESILPYDEGYIMPGVLTTERGGEMKSKYSENALQRTMLEMFYHEMLSDDSRLTLGTHDETTVEKTGLNADKDSDDSDSDDSQADGAKYGSYDVTSDDVVGIEDHERVILKSYEKYYNLEDAQRNGAQELMMTSSEEDHILTNGSDETSDIDTTQASYNSSISSPDYANVQHQNSADSKRKLSARADSYFTYQNLITPPGYNKGFHGNKSTSFTKKPPVPPKPIFH